MEGFTWENHAMQTIKYIENLIEEMQAWDVPPKSPRKRQDRVLEIWRDLRGAQIGTNEIVSEARLILLERGIDPLIENWS